LYPGGYIAGKVPHWYLVQEGDATMFHIAASLPGQKPLFNLLLKKIFNNKYFI